MRSRPAVALTTDRSVGTVGTVGAMQERIRRQSGTENAPEDVTETVAPGAEQGERLRDEIDDLLDEIDDVLESNAEEFVKNYVQKGGQ